MAHSNPAFRKLNEIKVRVDDYDDERLKKYIAKFGGEAAVIARNALIQYLDQAQIQYSDESLNLKLAERLQLLEVKQGIRSIHQHLVGSANESNPHCPQNKTA